MKRILALTLSFLIQTPLFAETPSYGDIYVDGSIGDASMLNPVLSSDSASNDINGLVYNGLVKYDKNIQLVGDLAESWIVSPNGLVITFKLRKNVKWHDGQPFTAEDVLFTYQKLRDPKVRTPFSSDFEWVESVTTPDPFTVRVVYKKRFAPGLASWGMGMIAKHIYKDGDFNTHPANRNPIGTGPYKLKEWKTAQYIVLEPFADYFEGKPYFSRYVYRIIPDQSVQFLEMRNQALDSLTLTPDQYKAYDSIFEHHQRYRYPAFQYIYMAFNLRNPLFADKRVRQALAYALDRQTLVEGLLLGLGQPITGPYPITSWAYNKDIPQIPFDQKKALTLLAEAGWTRGPDGILQKDGKPFTFTLMTNQGNKVRELAVQVIQQQLQPMGINVKVRIVEWSSFIHQFVDKKNFEAIVLGWNLGRDPDNYLMWHSSQNKEGQYNFVSYSNPEVDRLLELGRETFGEDRRKAIYWKIHAQLASDLPYIYLYSPDALIAIHKRIKGPEVAPLGIGWNFPHWYVPEKDQLYPMRVP